MADERLTALFTGIGDAIRGKEGSADPIPAQEMGDRVRNLPSGPKHITVMLSNDGEIVKCYDTAKGDFVTIDSTPVELTTGKHLVVFNSSGLVNTVGTTAIYLQRPGREEERFLYQGTVYATFGARRAETWVIDLSAMCANGSDYIDEDDEDFSADDWQYITKIVLTLWDM